MKKQLLHVFFHWLPLGVATITFFGFGYVAIHQAYRTSLNDPQIQLVTDGQIKLSAGAQPVEVVGRSDLFDIEKNLQPFVAVYDANGVPLESSGYLRNAPPKPPVGVFEYAKEHGEDRVTWQPNATTRIALVVRPAGNASGWFIASGRNMREVESRVQQLNTITALGLGISLLLSFLLDLLGDAWRRRHMK